MNELSTAELAVHAFLRETIEEVGLALTFSITLHPGEPSLLDVRFRGQDTVLLMQNGGDLLQALKYLATAVSGLEDEVSEPVSFSVCD
jgi:predicted RNA-binding protein Jag